MPSIIIIAYGSRGDVEPQFSLASALANDPYWTEICICVQPDFAHLIPNHAKIRRQLLPLTMKELLIILQQTIFVSDDCASPSEPFTKNTNLVEKLARAVAKMTSFGFKSFASSLFQLAKEMRPSVILGTFTTTSYCMAIGEKLSIPVAVLHMQVQSPTSIFPNPNELIDDAKASAKIIRKTVLCEKSGDEKRIMPKPEAAKANRESFKYGTRIWFSEQEEDINEFRASLGLKPMDIEDLLNANEGKNKNVRMISAYSRLLAPLPTDCGPYNYQSGPLADSYIPAGWDPQIECPDLADFLKKGEAPVCVSFGSMPNNNNAADLIRTIFTALQSVGVERVVLLAGNADLSSKNLGPDATELLEWASSRVFETRRNVQYAWLLPQCRLFVTHGGAGSVFSGLKAGIPVVVAPACFDQIFWGSLVAEFELGTIVGPNFASASSEDLENGIFKALHPEIIKNAREYKIRASGVPTAVEETAFILESLAKGTLGTRSEYEELNSPHNLST